MPRRKTRETAPSSLLAPLGIGLLDWACLVAAIVTSLYVPWVFHDLQFRVGNPLTIDWVMGTILIVVLLEACRRSVGAALPIIAIVLIAYAMLGRYLPGILNHAGNDWKGVVNHLYLTSQGIYGVALGVVATYVFHYVLFGVLATRIGLGRFFIDLATALAGRFSGGPAKVSIFASGLFGMISGIVDRQYRDGRLAHHPDDDPHRLSAPFRGRRRIDRCDRRPDHAADHGRRRLPDGRVPRRLLPDHHPRRDRAGLHAFLRRVLPGALRGQESSACAGCPAAELPNVREVLRRDWPTAIPLIVLLIVLFSGFTPYLAAFWGITACIVIGLTDRHPVDCRRVPGRHRRGGGARATDRVAGARADHCGKLCGRGLGHAQRRGTAATRLIDIADAFVLGAKYAISVGAAAATVGIIVGDRHADRRRLQAVGHHHQHGGGPGRH